MCVPGLIALTYYSHPLPKCRQHTDWGTYAVRCKPKFVLVHRDAFCYATFNHVRFFRGRWLTLHVDFISSLLSSSRSPTGTTNVSYTAL